MTSFCTLRALNRVPAGVQTPGSSMSELPRGAALQGHTPQDAVLRLGGRHALHWGLAPAGASLPGSPVATHPHPHRVQTSPIDGCSLFGKRFHQPRPRLGGAPRVEAGGGTHIADLLLEEADDLPLALHHLDVEVDDSTEGGGRSGRALHGSRRGGPLPPVLTAAGLTPGR